ncbi:MAG: signal peptidase I [Terracidiphilus sp.]
MTTPVSSIPVSSIPAPSIPAEISRRQKPWLSVLLDRRWPGLSQLLPTVPEALASLLRTVVVALFILTFVMQPFLIPSESMEQTLLKGDFLLCNKQVLASPGPIGRFILPYRNVRRGDIVVFHHPNPPLLIKRVVAIPGDRLRIRNGRVFVDGAALSQPYAFFTPASRAAPANFPARIYTNPEVDPDWWRQMQSLTQNGELTIPPGEYFVLGDNRNDSDDSRFWGFVPRQAILATPLVVYFSLRTASRDIPQKDANDKLGHDSNFAEKLARFARWSRIFRVVH